MQTKYILYGGHKKEKENIASFFEEMVRDIQKKNIHILYVPFAKEGKENIQKYYERYKIAFVKAVKNKQLHFALADSNPEKFLDQMHVADVIYLGGGNDELLKAYVKQIPPNIFQNHLEGKVVAGTSAGANVLAKYYYTNDRQRIEEGLGILPIKTICHYTEDKEPQLVGLENYKEHLTSFALPEDYFVIIQ